MRKGKLLYPLIAFGIIVLTGCPPLGSGCGDVVSIEYRSVKALEDVPGPDVCIDFETGAIQTEDGETRGGWTPKLAKSFVESEGYPDERNPQINILPTNTRCSDLFEDRCKVVSRSTLPGQPVFVYNDRTELDDFCLVDLDGEYQYGPHCTGGFRED